MMMTQEDTKRMRSMDIPFGATEVSLSDLTEVGRDENDEVVVTLCCPVCRQPMDKPRHARPKRCECGAHMVTFGSQLFHWGD